MIPLVTALLPLLPTVIRSVEGLFKAPKSGPAKMSATVGAVKGLVEKLVETGEFEGVTDEVLRGVVETVLAQMKQANELPGAPETVTVHAGVHTFEQSPVVYVLVRGEVVSPESLSLKRPEAR